MGIAVHHAADGYSRRGNVDTWLVLNVVLIELPDVVQEVESLRG